MRPAATDRLVLDAWLLLRRLEPDECPPIDSVFIEDHLDWPSAGYCDHGRIVINLDSSHYRSRDPLPIALLLHHEYRHALGDDEVAAYRASARFAAQHCPHLLGNVEASWRQTQTNTELHED